MRAVRQRSDQHPRSEAAGQGSNRPTASTGARLRAALFGLVLAIPLMLGGSPAQADDYDDQRAGHPLRIVAYVLHPVGVAIDYLILRPAHWLGSKEPVKTIVGHKDD